MSSMPFTPALQRLHRLGWQPGATMHDGWWPHLGLAAWRESYRRHPACRAAIDRLIVARRGFPRAPLPARLDDRQSALLSVEPRIEALIVALGVIALDCADHLLVTRYRTHLAGRIGERGCAQLLALHRGWSSPARVASPERLVDAATAAGVRWWRRDAGACVVATLLATRLPPADDAPLDGPDAAVRPAAFDASVAFDAFDAADAADAADAFDTHQTHQTHEMREMHETRGMHDMRDARVLRATPGATDGCERLAAPPDAASPSTAATVPTVPTAPTASIAPHALAVRNPLDASPPATAGSASDKLLKLARFL
ncbi:type III secretion system domain-containing protein [Burkholderia sp. MSMB617WGS]|uniref:type III secretion system domain-containing protein n=1 Tax=Burkholderia sp. MSMB617WGS TaxID=1637831 RepID=UPI0016492ABA|nr:type III secretion system domain-containing protein [Burkholderia sp. MSMB617WGS]